LGRFNPLDEEDVYGVYTYWFIAVNAEGVEMNYNGTDGNLYALDKYLEQQDAADKAVDLYVSEVNDLVEELELLLSRLKSRMISFEHKSGYDMKEYTKELVEEIIGEML
jgi:hypothetical protein